MDKHKIFISSVQKEFAKDRVILKDYLRNDPLLRRFFEPFIFEEIPAADLRADDVYLDEVRQCSIYIGLFGYEYGKEDKEGISPTQREFELATELNKHRLIFIKGTDDGKRHPKMRELIRITGEQVIRRRFSDPAELISNIYASLIQYLEDKEIIRNGPFDATYCRNALMSDLDDEKIRKFLRHARRARGFPLPDDAEISDVLIHLNLLDKARPTHAAILLFGKQPQRFLISSEIKCAHFHGIKVSKPIPSYQVYKGTVFDLVDHAVDFVMSKINLAVGTRAHSVQAPVEYEMPQEVVREAIVNAVAHRDYTSNGSVQVMLFADRLEVWNPGTLPSTLTLEKLRHPHGSVPGNPLLAEPLYLTKYIERMGTGTGDMIERCRKAGLKEPEFKLTDGFVTTIRRKPDRAFEAVGGQPESQSAQEAQVEAQEAQVEAQVKLLDWQIEILSACVASEKTGRNLLAVAGYQERTGNFKKGLQHLLEQGYIELTIPDKPQSSKQKYRLTEKGKKLLEKTSYKN